MSTTIDEKVVEMRMDNSNFEKNAAASIGTLAKLKQSLNLTGASKGLEQVNAAAGKVDMRGLGSAVDTVTARFSALQVMGVTTLANITNSAVNAGKNLVNSLTIAPISDGFREYEMTLDAVQTTMAGTGKTAAEVEKELKKLDEYADKTVYSTADMLNNLPKFTNAGVELETATKAMIGIANATALAGGGAGKASIAFYNLGQAIGTGYLTRMDYNSINNAGIATMEWKNQMVKAAIAAGTLTKAGDDLYVANGKNFTLQQLFIDGLQEQWATTEVMTKVFGDYGDETTEIGKKSYAAAQDIKSFSMMMDSLKATAGTGWKDTWQIMFGGLDEAKEFWTGLSNTISGIITSMADFRNGVLGGALGKGFGYLMEPINGIKKTMETISEPIKTVTKSLEDYNEVVNEVIKGDWGNAETRWNKLTKAGYDWITVQNMVNEKLGNSKRRQTDFVIGQKKATESTASATETNVKFIASLTKMSDAELKALNLNDKQIAAIRQIKTEADKLGLSVEDFISNIDEIDGRWVMINTFKNAWAGLTTVFKSIGTAWKETFPPKTIEERSAALYNIIAAVHKCSVKFKDAVGSLDDSDSSASKLFRTFKGLFAIVSIVTDVLGGGLKVAFKAVSAILGYFDLDILDVTAAIGDALVKFREMVNVDNLIAKALDIIVPLLKSAGSAIKDWIDEFKNIPQVQKAINSIKEAFSKLKDMDFKEIGEYIIEGLKNGLSGGAGEVVKSIIELGKRILSGICEILGIHSPSVEFFEIGKNIIQGLVNGLQNGVSVLWNVITNIGQKCIEFFNGIDWGALFAVGVSVGLIYTVKKIGDAFDTLTGPIDAFTGVLESFQQIEKAFAGVMKSLSMNLKADAMKKLATSIAILVGSVIALTFVDTTKLWNAVGVILALSTILVLLTVATEKMSKASVSIGKDGANVNGFKSGLLAIAGSLLILAATVKIIGSLDPEQAKQGFLGLAGLVVAIAAIFLAYGKLVKGRAAASIDKAGAMMIKISAALLLLVGVAKLIAGMSWEDMGKAAVGLGGLVGVIALLMAISMMPGKSVNKIGSMLLKISGAMLILVGVAKLIAGMSWEDMGKAAVGLGGLIGVIALLMAISMIPGKNVDQIGSTLLKISGAMLILTITAKILAGMEWADMGKAAVGLMGLSGVIAVLIGIVRLTGKDAPKIAGTLLALSVSIGILAGVAVMLSIIKLEGLAKGIIALGLLSTFMAGMIVATRGASDCKGNLIVMTVAIVAMAAAVAALSLVDGAKLAGATVALSVLMGMFALIVKVSGTAQSAVPTLIVTTVAVGLLGGILYLLAGLPIESTLGAAAALSVLLLSLSVSMVIIGKLGAMTPLALVSVGVMTLVVAALAGILYLLAGLPIESTLGAAAALSTLLLALSASCLILTVVGLGGPAALIGIASLAALIVGVGALIIAIGALVTEFPMLEEFLNTGIPIIEKIGYALGSFFGNIVAGFTTGVASGLPEIGACLSAFMTNLQPFIDGAKNIDASVILGIGALSGAIILLTAAELLAGIASFLTGGSSFAQLGTDLSAFMVNALPFMLGIKMVDPAALAGVKALAEAILILTAANVIEGMTSWLTGGNSLGNFGSQLGQLGIDLNTFATNLGTFDESKVQTITCAANAIKILAEAASTLPNEGGWAAALLGENSIATFGSYLPQLGLDLCTFATNLGTFDESKVQTITCASNAIKNMANAASEIPNEGGWAAVFAGDNSIATFGEKLPGLATNLNAFATNLGTFDDSTTATVTCAANAIKNMAEVASEIPNEGGWAAVFAGDNSIATFGDQLASVGTNLKKFATNLGTFGEDKIATIKSAVTAIKALSGLADADLKGANKNLPGFGEGLVDFASDLRTFCTELPSSESIATATKTIKKILDMIDDMSGKDASVISDFSNNLKKIGTDGVDKFVNAFTSSSAKTDVKDAGVKLMDKLIDGVESKESSFKTAVKSVATSGASAASDKASSFKSAGKDLGSGLVEGIRAKETAVYNAAFALGQKAVQGEKDGQKSNSPSKLTILAGKWLGEGLVIGIGNMTKAVYNAGYGLGESATNSISSTIARISDLVNTDIDAQPTIRPVLDLSDVSSGAGAINSMLDITPSIGLMSSIRSINSMASSSQNGVNDDVVSAINDLKKTIGGLSSNTTIIDGITYDDGSNITNAVQSLVRAARMERRV